MVKVNGVGRRQEAENRRQEGMKQEQDQTRMPNYIETYIGR